MDLSICGSFAMWLGVGYVLARLYDYDEKRLIISYTSLPPEPIRDYGVGNGDGETMAMVMWADLD